MMTLLRTAKQYTRNGLSVIPTNPQTKKPLYGKLPKEMKDGRLVGIWSPFQKRIPEDNWLRHWFEDEQANISIVTGAVSGNLVVFDFDYEAANIFPMWQKMVGMLSTKLPIVRTGQGKHVYVRFPFTFPNQKLAYASNGKVRIETRGVGGYVQSPPSRHSSGVNYAWENLNAQTIIQVTTPAAQHLLDTSFYFNEKKRTQLKRKVFPKTAVLHSMANGDALENQIRRYSLQALRQEAETLSQVVEGSRNDELNRSAFRMGRFVGGGLLQREEVRYLLHWSCQRNGLLVDDGENAFERTFCSGLAAGKKVENFKDHVISRVTNKNLLL